MPHTVFTEDGEAIEVNRHLDDLDPHDGNCTYIRHEHLVIGVRKGNTPTYPMIISTHYVLDPQTDIFMLQGMTTAEMPDYSLIVKVLGEVEWAKTVPLRIKHPGMTESAFSLSPL